MVLISGYSLSVYKNSDRGWIPDIEYNFIAIYTDFFFFFYYSFQHFLIAPEYLKPAIGLGGYLDLDRGKISIHGFILVIEHNTGYRDISWSSPKYIRDPLSVFHYEICNQDRYYHNQNDAQEDVFSLEPGVSDFIIVNNRSFCRLTDNSLN